ncbi:MAG TPA: DEAD/DEAH box helicase family protein [Chloroflexia bacterium]|nr:DEAD/DEAH box helicase family protein [Chloroflexia bacterium]
MSNEAQTRKELIDLQLEQAGWSLAQGNLLEEVLLAPTKNKLAESGLPYRASPEFADYTLLGRDGKPLAIVEAKRTNRDPEVGKRQAEDYAELIKASYGVDPFIFLSNGLRTLFWERGRYPAREVSGFYSRDDLERLAFQRRYQQPLAKIAPNLQIVERPYQLEAIRRVTEALEQGQRKFLLVMATGTGKTRTVIALVDLLMRARRVQKVLFLADRVELVQQALGAFKDHLPDETRARLEAGQLDHAARVHVATYPGMMQLLQQSPVPFSHGYYDLIIADESHRSIYNRYRAIFNYFDALQLGLTATPTDYIDHNTFELFECPGDLPTFSYPYQTAVQEGYLVDYVALDAQTRFQLEGIRAGQLPPEVQQELTEQGIELSEIDFEGSDLERRVTNTGTNDAIVREFMEKCRKDASGTLPARTIIFAVSHRHALELWHSFNRLYPDMQRRGLAEVIDSHMERADKTLSDFKGDGMPRVAISVDMLDTGIDVPAVQNLVFAKPVFSRVKFLQMIGRGTRHWRDPQTGQAKSSFLIIDYWGNFAYFDMNTEGEIANPTEPLPVRLFRVRLEKLTLLHGRADTAVEAATAAQLRQMLDHLPLDNFNLRPHLPALQELAQPSAWENLTTATLDRLAEVIAPLLRFYPDVNLPVMSFELRTERLAVAHLNGQPERVESLRDKVIQDLRLLPTTLREVQAHAAKLAWMTGAAFWQNLTYERVMDLQQTFAPLMRYRQRQSQEIIKLNLNDQITSRRWIIYGPGGEGAFVENYREQVEAHLKELAGHLPALDKLRQGQPLDSAELSGLSEALNRPDLFITPDTLRQVYDVAEAGLPDLLRHALGLQHLAGREERIKESFDEFLAAHPHFSAVQINFVRAVRSAVLREAHLSEADLERPPFSRVGPVRRLFSSGELAELLDFANRLVV